MKNSLKRMTIYGTGQYTITFYWAYWSLNVCMVKEHKITGSVAWKEMRSLPIARKLWATFCIDSERVGKKHAVSYDASIWDSERITWVREMLSE